MVYVSKYDESLSKSDILEKLKNPPEDLDLDDIEKFTVGDFTQGSGSGGFIDGKLSVHLHFVDKDFERTEDYEIETEDKDRTIYKDVGFTVFPDMDIITFSSKKKARKFGIQTLSKIIFGNKDAIKGIRFNPEAVLDAKNKGEFKNVWFTGVQMSGKVDYTQQYGTEIDEDSKFVVGKGRSGIGVEYRSKTGDDIKIAIYQTGSIVKKGDENTIKEEIKVRKEMIDKCLEYSDHENPTSDIKTGMREITHFT